MYENLEGIQRNIQKVKQNPNQLDDDGDQPIQDIVYNDIQLIYSDTPQQNSFCIQPLRSANLWSIGVNPQENSIQRTYVDMIQKAQRYIYIENQFFISSTAGNDGEPGKVHNTIVQSIVDRVNTAISRNQPFIVVIVLPLLPGFEGNVTKEDGQLLRVQIYWHLKTIRGMIKGLNTNDWKRYIKIYGLRNHGFLKDMPVTEIVYVHSKLMIVDDQKVILGSANINDRSMEGDRDSELAVYIRQEESQLEERRVNSQEVVRVSPQILELRMNIFKTLFGDQVNLLDIYSQQQWQLVDQITNFNSQFYLKVFGTYPDDSMTNLKIVEKYQKEPINVQLYHQYKGQV